MCLWRGPNSSSFVLPVAKPATNATPSLCIKLLFLNPPIPAEFLFGVYYLLPTYEQWCFKICFFELLVLLDVCLRACSCHFLTLSFTLDSSLMSISQKQTGSAINSYFGGKETTHRVAKNVSFLAFLSFHQNFKALAHCASSFSRSNLYLLNNFCYFRRQTFVFSNVHTMFYYCC